MRSAGRARLLAAALAVCAAAARANMLDNPGFERATGNVPLSWAPWGGGTVAVADEDAHSGRRCVAVRGGAEAQWVYQWTDMAVPGARYTFRVWAKSPGGPAEAFVKLEFMDGTGKKMQTTEAIGVTGRWRRFEFRRRAPETAVRVALTLGAAGATILYDDAEIAGKKPALSREIRFDLSRLAQPVGGFGVHHIAARQVNAAAEFANLHITHVRFSQDWSSWEDVATMRALTDNLGIKWLLVKWVPPGEVMGPNRTLRDVAGYATVWIETVRDFDRHGCRPHYLDLVNEPDYFGIPPQPYNELVKAVRRGLDAAGFRDVGIVGPGVTHVGDSNAQRYLDALDAEAAGDLAAWATHGWEDDDVEDMDLRSAAFAAACRARDRAKPVWYTEYATRSNRFHGVTYPNADHESRNYCASFTMAYAIRVYENTLSLFNHGVDVPFYWCSEDGLDDSKQWGFIGPRGERKPVYHALRALCGNLRPGARVVVPPADPALHTLYAGAFLDEGGPGGRSVVVALANSSAESRTATIRLAHAPPGLRCLRADRVEIDRWGDRERWLADTAKTTAATVKVRRAGNACVFDATLARDSAVTVILVPPGLQ